ncbi:MAG: hypothetical protein U9Q71_06425 [Pseudomonadota bacterium]|nr:hypothetical protein [Pseudomonadota bacterium]
MSLPRILLYFVLFLTGLLFLLLWAGDPPEQPVQSWPWQIETLPGGKSRVFGLTLPESTLEQATERFRDLPEVAVFRSFAGNYSLEAFYKLVVLAGLKAKVVLRLEPADVELEALFTESAKVRPQKSGELRAMLNRGQTEALAAAPISSLTYLPATRLDAATIRTRFGEPARKIEQTETRSHWLYPEKGLVITLDDKEKEVLQYVAPQEFEALRESVEQGVKQTDR